MLEKVLHLGDGSVTAATAQGSASRLVAGGGGSFPEDESEPFPAEQPDLDAIAEMAVGPDGSIYELSGPCPHGGIRRIAPDGPISQFAGRPVCGEPTGDGGPARDAVLGHTLRGIDVGPDGSVYISVLGDTFPNGYIRRIAPDGTISTLAGRATGGSLGDGGPAKDARVSDPLDVKIGPDGAVYFGERPSSVNGNKARIRRIDPSGRIDTFAGGGVDRTPGEYEEPAVANDIPLPYGLAFGPDGSL